MEYSRLLFQRYLQPHNLLKLLKAYKIQLHYQE